MPLTFHCPFCRATPGKTRRGTKVDIIYLQMDHVDFDICTDCYATYTTAEIDRMRRQRDTGNTMGIL